MDDFDLTGMTIEEIRWLTKQLPYLGRRAEFKVMRGAKALTPENAEGEHPTQGPRPRLKVIPGRLHEPPRGKHPK